LLVDIFLFFRKKVILDERTSGRRIPHVARITPEAVEIQESVYARLQLVM